MTAAEIIDIDGLIAPVSEDTPSGSDVREDSSPNSPYYQIKDARNAARAAERNNLFEGNNSEADASWRSVAEKAPDILQNHSKDLEIACWYTEALVRRHGFQGLQDGFILIRHLLEDYWDALYPMPDEDGIETRVAPLTGLNGQGADGVLIVPIRNVSITAGEDPGPYSFWQYQQALDVQKISDESTKTKKQAAMGFSIDDIEKSVNASSPEFFITSSDAVSTCIEEYRRIGQLLDEHCGTYDAPPISNIVGVLEECLGAIKHLGKDKLPSESEADIQTEGEQTTTDGNSAPAAATAGGPVQNRDGAFRQLLDIAEFFRKTEPHSPVSYLLEKTVQWGRMPLNELIGELIPDTSSREHYSSLTGVKVEEG